MQSKMSRPPSKEKTEEILMLTTLLDEMLSGRFLEAADIAASRMRMLGYGLEHHTWEIAEEFLCYRTKGPGLVSNDDIDIALRMRRKEKRRREELRRAGAAPASPR